MNQGDAGADLGIVLSKQPDRLTGDHFVQRVFRLQAEAQQATSRGSTEDVMCNDLYRTPSHRHVHVLSLRCVRQIRNMPAD